MSELVDKWEDKDVTSMTVWMHRKRSTGGRSVSPHPVVYACRTCDGTGEVVDHELMEMAHCPNADCTEGWVANIGTIEHHCTVHGLKQDAVSVRLGLTPICHANGLTPADTCVMSLVLVVPIGDGDETTM